MIHTPARYFPEFELPPDWWKYCRADLARPGPPDPPDKPPSPFTRFDFLRELALAGMDERYGPDPEAAVLERLDHELAVVREVGYADYFLIVWDICREAHARKIPTLARGSAADSLVCYCLKISTVCPLRFNLYFERFLNKERMKFSKLADIDLDFPWDQRDEMMEYVFDKYGHDYVAMIGGFNRFHGRAAVGDIGKVFGLSESEVRYFTKRMPSVRADQIAESLVETVRARELPVAEEPYPEIIELARSFESLPRHFMMHPCGIVVSRVPLADLMPLQPSGRGPQMTQFDMDAVEDIGLIKIDLLGQAGLSVLRDVLASVKEKHGVEVDLDRIPWDDSMSWDMIAQGGARGVHHIESPAMTSLLVQSNCRDMDCLCAIVSVIRPGAADEAKKLAFTRRHQGFDPPDYPHYSLQPYLCDTYGLLVYEEHILMVAHHFAGMNLGRADVLRRELVKMKSPELLVELGREFVDCARTVKKRKEEDVMKVWETLVRFHGYMFNKAHSASYAVEAFQGAYLKARWPAEYMAAVLNNQRGFYSPLFYSLECRRLGVTLLTPCVNASRECYDACDGKAIRLPLWTIKNLTRATYQCWCRERKLGAFEDVEDFFDRVRPLPSECRFLVDSGALDVFSLRRTDLFWQIQSLADPCVRGNGNGGRAARRRPSRASSSSSSSSSSVRLGEETVNAQSGGHDSGDDSAALWQLDLFDRPVLREKKEEQKSKRALYRTRIDILKAGPHAGADDDGAVDNRSGGVGGGVSDEAGQNLARKLQLPPDLTEPSPFERASREMELFGFPVTLDPWSVLGPEVDWSSYCAINQLIGYHERRVRIAGIVIQTRHNHTLHGDVMMFCTLADRTGFVECTLWPRDYRRYGHLLNNRSIIAVEGRVDPFDNRRGHTVEIRRLSEPRERLGPRKED